MREKAYIMLGKNANGIFVGQTEHSFSMGISRDHVRLFRPYTNTPHEKTQQYNQERVSSLAQSYPKYKWHVYRVGSKNCPVKINWTEYHAIQKSGNSRNADYRNLPFTKK